MRDVLGKILSFLKYILFIIAFGLVFYSIMKTYGRLEKPLSEAINVFIPFGLVLITFLISLVTRAKYVSKSLLFNFVSVLFFIVVIIVCLRAMFDNNMVLFYRYGIDYNPAFLSDNLAGFMAILYMIFGANVILLLCSLIDRNKKGREVRVENKIIQKSDDEDNKAREVDILKKEKKHKAEKQIKEESEEDEESN